MAGSAGGAHIVVPLTNGSAIALHCRRTLTTKAPMPHSQHLPTWQQLTPRYTFHTVVAADSDPQKATRIRKTPPPLSWHLIAHMPPDDPDYLVPPGEHEFDVIDLVEKEKAIFEWPKGLSADQITGWVSGWFGCTAQRVAGRTWVV